MEFVKWVDEQNYLVKVLLFFPVWGWVIGFLYRLFKFLNDNTKTINLVGAILFIVPGIGWIFAIIEFILVILTSKPTLLVD